MFGVFCTNHFIFRTSPGEKSTVKMRDDVIISDQLVYDDIEF